MNDRISILNDLDESNIALSVKCDVRDLNKYIPRDKISHTIVSQSIRSERDVTNNYRPTSSLQNNGKIINKRLIGYLNKFNILSDSQYDFRQGRSTEDAILTLTTLITNCVDKGKKWLAVFLYLKKAFHTVSLPILIHKLGRIGIRRHPLKVLSDYLTGRTQQAR